MRTIKKIPIGTTDFKKLIEEDYYYVDKTNVIEKLITTGADVVLFPRPRRFGKSLFLSMLDNFFNIETKKENKNLFKDLYINKSDCYKNFGKYPIIHLDFKDMKESNYNNSLEKFKILIQRIFTEKSYIKEVIDKDEKDIFKKYKSRTASEVEYKESIKYLSMWLKKYYKEKVIILIDEYDTPIQAGYNNGFYKEIIEFMRGIFGSALKGNNSVKMGILTGVLRVSNESLFSEFNNLKVYSMMENNYNEAFGFTESETKKLLLYYDLKLTKEVKNYYDGYNFSGLSIYNPWSIMNYVNDKKIMPYWINTSSNTLITDLLTKMNEENKLTMQKLINKESISFNYDSNITYLDFNNYEDIDKVLNLLLASGYLTFDKKVDNIDYFKIPNEEVRLSLAKIMQRVIINKTLLPEQNITFVGNILNGNKEEIEHYINELLTSLSYLDLTKEISYHLFLMGLLAPVIEKGYIVKSNRETGLGRADILIETKDRKYGGVIELKVANTEKEINKKINEAKKQIKTNNYINELKLDKVNSITTHIIVFYKKKCIVK